MIRFNIKNIFKKENAFKKRSAAAFSLVEVMTVLFVIALGMVGVLNLMIQNIQSQSINKSALMAYQLAQEGIELVRHTRDSNWVAASIWNTNLAPNRYTFDYREMAPRLITFSGQENLKTDSSGYFYNPNSSVDLTKNSGYSRVIDITANAANPASIFVKSTVSWIDRNKNYSYVLETTLYDWK